MCRQKAKALLKELLSEAGACAMGVARAVPVEDEYWQLFSEWLESGCHAGMHYMEKYAEVRRDPRLLLDNARSVVSVAFSYRQPNPIKGLATYALGLDYHVVLRKRLEVVVNKMQKEFGGNYRICIDSAPIPERYWAVKSGVGYRSPLHGNIVVPGVGSMVFLAEILTTLELPADNPVETPETQGEDYFRICPVGALLPGGGIDARKCLNYLTIENRDEPTEEQKTLLEKGGWPVFGCDICIKGAPENSGNLNSQPVEELRLQPGLPEFIEYVKKLREGTPVSEKVEYPIRKTALARAGIKRLSRKIK